MKYIDTSYFYVEEAEPAIFGNDSARKLRCASVLKPIYVWAYTDLKSPLNIKDSYLAKRAIIKSSDVAMSHLWQKAGGKPIVEKIYELTGVNLTIDKGTWGSVLINSYQLSQLYAALCLDDSHVSNIILSMMSKTPDKLTFGIKNLIIKQTGKTPSIKAGWYMSDDEDFLRTHIVSMIKTSPGHYFGTCIITAVEIPKKSVNNYRESLTKNAIIKYHEQYSSDLLFKETKRLYKNLTV